MANRKSAFGHLYPIRREDWFNKDWKEMARGLEPYRSGPQALEFLRKSKEAARQNNPEAALRYTYYLLKHPQRPSRGRQAQRFCRIAKEGGLARSWYYWGLMAIHGIGQSVSERQALRRWQEGAYQGSIHAMLATATAYQEGIVKKDEQKALYWWRLASAYDITIAHRQVGILATKLGRDEEALTHLLAAANAHDKHAHWHLYLRYQKRNSPFFDAEKAFTHLKEAALLGWAQAQFRLALMFWAGQSVIVNQRESLRWLARSAESEYPQALVMLASFFRTGSLVTQNIVFACALLQRARKQNSYDARLAYRRLFATLSRRRRSELRSLLHQYPSTEHMIETILPRKKR